VRVEIDYSKYEQDGLWDGLKGFITNSKLADECLVLKKVDRLIFYFYYFLFLFSYLMQL
jgi:hypothetical protein